MITIKITRNSQKLIKQVEMSGHAGYADPGYDIVCSAVSSQIISVENSITQLLKVDVQTEVDEVSGGYLNLVIPQDIPSKQLEHDTQLLLKHLEFAFQVLAENYPEFIKIQQIKD